MLCGHCFEILHDFLIRTPYFHFILNLADYVTYPGASIGIDRCPGMASWGTEEGVVLAWQRGGGGVFGAGGRVSEGQRRECGLYRIEAGHELGRQESPSF